MCDEADDCNDGSDEANCDYSKDDVKATCKEDEFQCYSGECISLHLACNNHPDCHDSSDEHDDCSSSCLDNGGCPHACLPTPKGPICQCHSGYNFTQTEDESLCGY